MPGIQDFRDKVVVITGAGSGIGRATALAFADEGADLVLADIHEDRLDDAAAEIRQRGARVITRAVDVSKKKQVKDLAGFVISRKGCVDILYNNAGVAIGADFESTSLKEFEWIFSINFWGMLYGIKAFLPYMIERRTGHIVNTSSVAGLCATPGMSAYCSTKFAIAGLGESLRAELKKYNIGVSTICPGVIDTRIVADGCLHLKDDTLATNERVVNFYRRFGWPPERVARAVLKAVRKNRSVVPVGPEAWLQWIGKRLSQRNHDATVEFVGRLLMNGKR